MKIPKKVTAGQAVQAQTINDLINSVQLLKDRRDFDEDSGNDDTITPHAFWADMEWQDPDADGYVAGKEMRATFTQGYVQCLITGNKIPVFRHPLERVKQIEEDDFYELVVYTGGDGGVTAVRFVEGVAEGQTEIDDFDLQEIADAITEAEGAVPEELTAAIAAAAEDDLSGTKNRVKVVEFRREDDPGQDDLEPGEVATKHWEVDYWCKNDILWGVGGGGGCDRWNLSVRYDEEGSQWYFSVALGLLNDVRSAQFDEETNAYEAAITGVDDIQIGLKVQLKAPVNVALYVMPGSDPTFPELPDTPADMLTFVEEAFADYEFTATDLPNGKTATGFAVLPIGKIAYNTETQSYSVEERKLQCDVNGIFSPVNGYVVYESVL